MQLATVDGRNPATQTELLLALSLSPFKIATRTARLLPQGGAGFPSIAQIQGTTLLKPT